MTPFKYITDQLPTNPTYDRGDLHSLTNELTAILDGIGGIKVIVYGTRVFAIDHHGSQKYGKLPYISHLDDTLLIGMAAYGNMLEHIPEDYLISLIIHDVLEDTKAREVDIKNHLGETTLQISKHVKNDDSLSREEKSIALNKLLSKVDEKSEVGMGTLIVKMSDRFANMYRTLLDPTKVKLRARYWAELDDFLTAVTRADSYIDMNIRANHPNHCQVAYSNLYDALKEMGNR
ncbi:hypothetical protein VCHA53O466_40042 [Vibrio chagasii]|nr:hypothetical protein VCHA53O466_40042 [Vibrio chagasii]